MDYSIGNDGVLDGGGEDKEKPKLTGLGHELDMWRACGECQSQLQGVRLDYRCVSVTKTRRAEAMSGTKTGQRTVVCPETELRSMGHC